MAYSPHIRVTFGGTLDDAVTQLPTEIWACTVNVIPAVGTPANFDSDGYLADVAPALGAWFSNSASYISSLALLTYVKANAIGANGHYASETQSHVFDYDLGARGDSGPKNPDIISICTTWDTAIKRGPGSHGRVFLPNPCYGTNTSITITPTDQANAVAAGKALLTALAGTVPATIVYPVVASGVNATNSLITGVRVGSVKDVQRRRKDALKETYVSANWP